MRLNELFETWIRLELELNFSRALAQLPGGAKIFVFPSAPLEDFITAITPLVL